MLNIKEIVLKIAEEMPSGFLWHEGCGHEAGILIEEAVDFAEALIAELAKQNEPVALIDGNDEAVYFRSDVMYHYWIGRNCTPLYTFPPTAEQIANETAEACAKYVNRFLNGDGIQDEAWIRDIESGIRRGAWKEFK